MFKKILIANRGEIACRVIRTARDMGIATVAVYSDADAGALHTRLADEAVHIGGAASSESYLVIDKVLAAVRETGAEAVHPGYGFLSENAGFAEALAAAGVAFIGPNVAAIAAMGDKIESKKLAEAAGVSTVPGYPGVLADEDEALRAADSVGYPVMIKASAGGGGKGMRVAWGPDELREGFRSAVNEARSSFGDDRVFIEKFIEDPRHIEIQIIADTHGNILYLGERECSIQRRHQKVIEEAPSPFLDAATRKAMGKQAVALARAVDYRSAGTVEFIVDSARKFYFLEMNTRLQVEHPVTEMVTGLDLVELMIRVADGEKLPLAQKDVRLDGWSMEARVYAEDPYRGFLPSVGRLTRYSPPPEGAGVRIDSGVEEGAEISMFYDPMIAKLVTSGADRGEAMDRMAAALNSYRIRGVSHNIDFLAALMAHPRFREGRLSTGFIAEEFPDGFAGTVPGAAGLAAMSVVAAAFEWARIERASHASGPVSNRANLARYVVRDGAEQAEVRVAAVDGGYDVTLAGAAYRLRGACDPAVRLFTGTLNEAPLIMQIEPEGIGWRVQCDGGGRRLDVLPARVAALWAKMPVKEPADMSRFLVSPMPGLLVSVAVAEGDAVKEGQELAVVEAMKMENVMRAERAGTVAKIHAGPGSSLTIDQTIIEFE